MHGAKLQSAAFSGYQVALTCVSVASAAALLCRVARPSEFLSCFKSGLQSWLSAIATTCASPATTLAPPLPPQSLDLTANRLRSLEPCLLALTGLRRLCLRQNLVSQPGEVEALGSAPGGCCSGGC